MINKGSLVALNAAMICRGDTLREMLDIPFLVTHIDEENLICLHSFPINHPSTVVVMGVHASSLTELSKPNHQRLILI